MTVGRRRPRTAAGRLRRAAERRRSRHAGRPPIERRGPSGSNAYGRDSRPPVSTRTSACAPRTRAISPGSSSATARTGWPGRRAGSSSPATRSCCSPTAATGSRPSARHPVPGSSRSTAISRRAGRSSSAAAEHPAGRRRGGVRQPRDVDEARDRRTGRRALGGRRAHRGRSGDQGAGRARAGRRCLCRRRSGPRDAAAGDPHRCDRTRARAAAGVADPDERCRRPRVRCRVSGRTGGGPAPRFARRSAGAGGPGPAVRFRGAGRRLSERHDPDPLRRRTGGSRSGDLRARRARPGRDDRRRCAARWPRAGHCRVDEPPTGSRASVIVAAGHGERFGHGTGHGIGLATHELPSLGLRASDDAAAVADRLQRRTGGLSRRRDGGPDRGPAWPSTWPPAGPTC